jgi:hypothetical protein
MKLRYIFARKFYPKYLEPSKTQNKKPSTKGRFNVFGILCRVIKENIMVKRTLLALGLAAFVLIGCGGPPKEDIEKAGKAKVAADAAKAADYAKETYDAAVASMTAGADAVKKSEWEKAKKAYMEAGTKFTAAAAEAPAKMKEMQDATTAKVADLKKMMEATAKDKMVMAAMKGKDKAKFEAMKKEAEAMMTEGEGMIADNAMGAMEKLTAAGAKLDEIKMMANPVKK